MVYRSLARSLARSLEGNQMQRAMQNEYLELDWSVVVQN